MLLNQKDDPYHYNNKKRFALMQNFQVYINQFRFENYYLIFI
jgi:hypothetical protein